MRKIVILFLMFLFIFNSVDGYENPFSRDEQRIRDMNFLNVSLQQYYMDNSEFPSSLDELNKAIGYYMSYKPEDPLGNVEINGCKFGYLYEVGDDSYGITNSVYRLSSCLEKKFINGRKILENSFNFDSNSNIKEKFYINGYSDWKKVVIEDIEDIEYNLSDNCKIFEEKFKSKNKGNNLSFDLDYELGFYNIDGKTYITMGNEDYIYNGNNYIYNKYFNSDEIIYSYFLNTYNKNKTIFDYKFCMNLMDEYSDEYDELYIENVGDDIYLFLDNDAIKFHNFRSLTKLQEESIISKNIDSRRIDKTAEIYNLIITNYVPKNKLEFEKLTSEIDFSDLFSNDSKCDYFYVYRYGLEGDFNIYTCLEGIDNSDKTFGLGNNEYLSYNFDFEINIDKSGINYVVSEKDNNLSNILNGKTKPIILKEKIINKYKLSNIKSGNKYIKSIDSIFLNFSDTNKEKLYLKIQKILPKYENKNDEKSKNIYYIFKYMESSILLDLFNNMDTSNNIISLDSPFSQARDSKRLSDVNNLLKKINIEMVKGQRLSDMVNVKKSYDVKINGNTEKAYLGTINFDSIKEYRDDFVDNIGTIIDYPIVYSAGGSGTGAFKFIQISTISENNNKAVVVGNYYKMKDTDSESLIINNNGDYIINGGKVLPY